MKASLLVLLASAVQAFQAPISPLALNKVTPAGTTALTAVPPPTKKSSRDSFDYEYAAQQQQQDDEDEFRTTSTTTTTTATKSSSSFSLDDLKNLKLPENFQMPNTNMALPDFANVLASFSEGELGSRGEIYFVAQVVLVLGIVFGGNLPFLDTALFIAGPVLLVGGLATVVLSVSDLGDSLSPFTTPTARGSLKTTGVYSYVRHPMYTGLLATMAGFSLVTDSATRLLMTAVLWAVLNMKTEMEETELQNMYPGEFARYQQTVTGKFFPNEWWDQVKPGNSNNDNNKMAP